MSGHELISESPLSPQEAKAMIVAPLSRTPLIVLEEGSERWAYLGPVRRVHVDRVIKAIQSTGARAKQDLAYDLEAFRDGGLVKDPSDENVGVYIEQSRFFSFIADTLHL